jgi:hypothetical protein
MLGYRNDLHHIPILREYVAHTLKKSPTTTVRAIIDHHVPHVGDRGEPTPLTYAQISDIYGITHSEIEQLIQLICTTNLATLVDHPLIRLMIASEEW